MIITSKDNATIKNFRRLLTKKERIESGRFLTEGYRAVKDSLAFLTDPEILLSESAAEKYAAEFSSYSAVVCSDAVFSSVSETENSQGVICSSKIVRCEPDYDAEHVLLLDRLRDPGNMGTIIRTALATGFNEIYCLDCVDPYSPKTVRSAVSALPRVRLHEAEAGQIAVLKGKGYTIASADMNGKNIFTDGTCFKKICLVIGNEANGVSDEISTMSDIILSLPMKAGESLNAGAAASVLMYMLAFSA